MNTNSSVWRVHPFIIFWIGVLTGALVVGLVFLYNFLNSEDYTSALLRMPGTTKSGQVTSPTNQKKVPAATSQTSGAATQRNARGIGGGGTGY